jgi:biopolymer transport protein ExbD
MAGSSLVQSFDEINITPLTDIFLVLLIIMMVVAPMMTQQRQDVKLPAIAQGEQVEAGQNTLEITASGQLFLAGQPVAEASLGEELKKLAALKSPAEMQVSALPSEAGTPAPLEQANADEDKNAKLLMVRGDKTSKAKVILSVMSAARKAGYSKIVLVGDTAPTASPQAEAANADLLPQENMSTPAASL